MHSNQIYYRFKCETKEETMTFDEPELTVGDLRQRIRAKKFGNAPEKFELILKDPNTKREYSDMEFIKPKTTVLILRMPGHKPLAGGVYVQPTEDVVEESKKYDLDGKMEGSEKSKSPQEERSDALLLKYNVTPGHRLYPFLKNSRFFIIKCANEKNLETSQKNEEWATTTFNQDKLDKAYQSCSNVIFFFSVNKSAHFQGMAKMVSGLTNRVSREWQSEGVRLGYSFKVKWIVTSKMPFTKISNLKNPLTNEPIRKARDTTEISEEVGIQIALYIDEFRVPGGIDLPSTIASIPNFDVNKLTVMDQELQAQKAPKIEEKVDTFDLFDDLIRKEEPTSEAFIEAEPTRFQIEEQIDSKDAASKKDESKREESVASRKISELERPAPVEVPPLVGAISKPPVMWPYGPYGQPGMPGAGMGQFPFDPYGRYPPYYGGGGYPPMEDPSRARHPSASKSSSRRNHHRSRHRSRSRSRHRSRDRERSKSRRHEDKHKHHSRRDRR